MTRDTLITFAVLLIEDQQPLPLDLIMALQEEGVDVTTLERKHAP